VRVMVVRFFKVILLWGVLWNII